MPRIKREFKCGHKGFGQFCHLCEQIAAGELEEVKGKYQRPKGAKPLNRRHVIKDRVRRVERVTEETSPFA